MEFNVFNRSAMFAKGALGVCGVQNNGLREGKRKDRFIIR